MILVEVGNTFLVNMGKEYVVLLRGIKDERTLPIAIGQLEAQSIAIHLNNIPFPRPLTHDLFKSVLTEMDCLLIRTEISNLSNETFFAKLIFRCNNQKIVVDARPSDAIALALRFAAPIYVDDTVMNDAGVVISDESNQEEPILKKTEDLEEAKLDLTPIELLQRQLKKAVSEERYEDAAKLKCEIDNLAKSN